MTWRCWLRRHDWTLAITPRAVFLRCVSCEAVTPGWTWAIAPRWSPKVLRFVTRLKRKAA